MNTDAVIIEPLQLEQASAYFDGEQRIAYVAYRGSLGDAVTVQVYEWLDTLFKQVDIQTVYGEIFDFTKVTEFQPSNLEAARKNSKRLNLKMDVSHLPVALIVDNSYQLGMLETAMRISPEHQRKRIVWSREEAMRFLEEWNTLRRE